MQKILIKKLLHSSHQIIQLTCHSTPQSTGLSVIDNSVIRSLRRRSTTPTTQLLVYVVYELFVYICFDLKRCLTFKSSVIADNWLTFSGLLDYWSRIAFDSQTNAKNKLQISGKYAKSVMICNYGTHLFLLLSQTKRFFVTMDHSSTKPRWFPIDWPLISPINHLFQVQKSQESQDGKDKEKIIKYLVHYLGWSKK